MWDCWPIQTSFSLSLFPTCSALRASSSHTAKGKQCCFPCLCKAALADVQHAACRTLTVD